MRGVRPHFIGGQDRDRITTHEGDAGGHRHIAIFRVEAAGQVYNETNEILYHRGNEGRLPRRSVHRGRLAHAQSIVQLPDLYPRTIRPTERSPPVQTSNDKSRGTPENAVRLHHLEPARVPLRHAGPSSPQLPDSQHQLAKEQSHRLPGFSILTPS